MSSQILLGSSLSLIAAALYAFVAHKLGTRQATNPEDGLAWLAFRVWWFALAASTLSGVLTTLFVALGISSIIVFQTINLVNLLALSIALWGLLYYLIYVYTGRQNLARPIGVFYFLFFITLVAFVFYQTPVGVEMGTWSARVVYERQAGPAYTLILLLILIVPPIIASLGMLVLAFRVRNRSQKYRTSLVSLGIFVWFGISLLASFLGLNELPAWPLISRVIGLLAALVILWAYFPPMLIQRRFNIAPIS